MKRALDPARYHGATAFEKERETIFCKSWRLIGHMSMIPNAGDYLSDHIAGSPVLVLRDDDGGIRGFHNVCRHRAGPLVNAEAGNCDGALTCKYHGWRYALDGRLRSARDFGAADGFDPRDFGLYTLKTEFWRGFIFASLDNDAPSISELMKPAEEGWKEETVAPFALRRSHEIACNWKTYVENYLEGYHVADIHPGLDRDIDSTAYRVEMNGAVAIHHAPPRNPEEAVYSGYWAWVWPWLGVNVYSHGVMMERMTPVAPEKTRLDYLYFFDPERTGELADMMALSDEVTGEDKRICEQVQANLRADVYEAGPISPKHEVAVAWFQDEVRKRTGA